MINLITECNDFMKGCGFPYAVCGGYALELFCGKKLRPHGDIDITVFEEDRGNIVRYMLNKGWNVYEHKIDWINNKETNSYLRSILNSDDEKLAELNVVWAIKSGCTLVDVKPKDSENHIYDYEIVNDEQLCFDFFEINFNKRESGNFVFDTFSSQGQYLTRELKKAVLYTDDAVPYLAPEVNLFMNSHPEYLKSNYHRAKNILDFDTIAPLLSEECREWFINALETAYPDGLERLTQLKKLNAYMSLSSTVEKE